MASKDLTPIERGILVALMASGGGPLEQARLCIGVRAEHRTRLAGRRLIRVREKTRPRRHYALELSEAGWKWAREEVSKAQTGPPPQGNMGLGALYALLAGLGRHVERMGSDLDEVFVQTTARRDRPKEPAGRPTNGADETAWQLADDSLARALQQTPILRSALAQKGVLPLELRSYVGATIDALRHAARLREMEAEGAPGDLVEFNRAIHSDDDPRAQNGVKVRIVRPAIMQGNGTYRRVLRRAEVEIV